MMGLSGKNDNIEKATLIHPDGRKKTIRNGAYVTGGSHDARLFVRPASCPQWEMTGMDVVISQSPGVVEFTGEVVDMANLSRSVANPKFLRRYSLKDDS